MKILIDKVLHNHIFNHHITDTDIIGDTVVIRYDSDNYKNHGGLYVRGSFMGKSYSVDAYVTCVDDEGYPL